MAPLVAPDSRLALLPVAAVLLVTVLAGCIGGGGSSSSVPDANATDTDRNETEVNETDLKNKSPIDAREDTEFDANSTFHVHDYWGGDERIEIVDEQRSPSWQSRLQAEPLGALSSVPRFTVDVLPRDDRPNFVYPGTGKVVMELTWSGDESISPRVCVTNAGHAGNICSASQTRSFRFQSPGDVRQIDRQEDSKFLRPETVDPPHALKSNWRFQVWICEEEVTEGVCTPARDVTDFGLKVSIVRGNESLPLDPPHFAFYGNKDELTIVDDVTVQSGQADASWPRRTVESTRGEQQPIWAKGGFWLANFCDACPVPVVPVQTEVLLVTLSWSSPTAEMTFGYKSARTPWADPYEVVDGGSSCGETCVGIEVPMPDDGDVTPTDSPYAHQTQWRFAIFPAQDPPRPLVASDPGGYEITLSIHAYKDLEALP